VATGYDNDFYASNVISLKRSLYKTHTRTEPTDCATGTTQTSAKINDNNLSFISGHIIAKRDEDVPKTTINNAITLFFYIAINILLISNHNSYRVLFAKIASVYILFEKYIRIFSTGNGQPREPALCQLYRHTLVPYTCALRPDDNEFGDGHISG